ncbi:MAG: oxygen-independent coproporphyrinogen III oxidase [Hyphomicrobiaceae bacterium]|nr:oxygen-independent coproporphyrinogen III oxidase [Hyphomicrobiaceae bacterium]MCC0023324.1 oxygen-independent coproporphyrinogen III oxidase [Hyphomicrobiaceae bacterium]
MAGVTLLTGLAGKYAAPVPRYTSYPTAPHFVSAEGDEGTYRSWLSALTNDDRLSLYFHIPFCDRLCWFCGCHTKQTLRYDPIAAYLERLIREIDMVADAMPDARHVTSIHFGGGSPSMLNPEDVMRIFAKIWARFDLASDAEISLEIDPSDLTEDKLKAWVAAGLTRASIGVQDFDEDVQAAINRPQSFELTRDVVEMLRAAGVRSLNLDVLYGLPLQTESKIADTIDKVISLAPDRIALFGYAHVPWMKTHQRMINEDDLPGVEDRFAQAQLAAVKLVDAGFERIGLDHFAQPEDSMARALRAGELRRNFQGYTDDSANALIGFGASSIGETSLGYSQNLAATPQYLEAIDAGHLPVGKFYALTDEDRARKRVIEKLMCELALPSEFLKNDPSGFGSGLLAEAAQLAQKDEDGFFKVDAEGYHVTETGRPFVRVLAAHFDAYLNAGKARHSVAV